jgi:CO dehydrogenase maturation factor
VTLLVMGTVDHAGVGCRCNAHAAARGIMGHLMQADAPVVISDMEAGLEHLGRGTVEHADALLILIEPYYRALEAGRRMVALAAELGVPRIYAVANKIRVADEETAVRAFCQQHGLRLLAVLPFDDRARSADANGLSLLETNSDGPLARAIAGLAEALKSQMADSR